MAAAVAGALSLSRAGPCTAMQMAAYSSESHPPTDNLWRFLHVIDSSNGETPVGNWAPEVRTHEIVPEVLAPDIVRRFAHQRSSHGRAVGGEAAT